MKKTKTVSIVILLIFWQVIAMVINNDILIPMPFDVFAQMGKHLVSYSFYGIVLSTLSRMILGLIVAFGIGFILALWSSFYQTVKESLSVLVGILQAVPNMSFMIILLIWVGSELSVIVVSFLVLFPIFYQNILSGIQEISQELKDVYAIYPISKKELIMKVYIPHIQSYILSAFKVTFGLGFKVSVMAEILTQVNIGIGKQMYYSRNMLDMTSIFAWTIWIICISFLVDALFDYFMKGFKCKDI